MILLRDCHFLVSDFYLSCVCVSLTCTSPLLSCLSFDRRLFFIFQAWSRWQEQLLHVQRERQKLVCAVKHHQHWQKGRCLKAWLDYLQARRVKRQRNGEWEVPGLRDRGLGHSFHSPSASGANLLRRGNTRVCPKSW